MEQKLKAYIAYCPVCHNYVFMAPKEEPTKLAAMQHAEKTNHTVIVGYEVHKKEQ